MTATCPSTTSVTPGARLPSFLLPNQNGTTTHSGQFLGQYVVLTFLPEGRLKQIRWAKTLSEKSGELSCRGAVVLAVSRKEAGELLTFIQNNDLDLMMLSDRCGTLRRRLLGESALKNHDECETMLIDPQGFVKGVWSKGCAASDEILEMIRHLPVGCGAVSSA